MPETKISRHRSSCPLASTLDLFGDKWSLLIVRDLIYFGPSTFKKLSDSAERIRTNILTDRLKRLEEIGVIAKHPYQDRPVRFEYALTEKGLSLIPIVKAMTIWGQQNIPSTITIVASENGIEKLTRNVSVNQALLTQG